MTARRFANDSELLSSARREIDRLCELLDRHEAELSASKYDSFNAAEGLRAVRSAIQAARRLGSDAELALNRGTMETPPAESLAKADSNE